MSGFLDQFRKKVLRSVWKDSPEPELVTQIDDKIALGVLLSVVAQADQKFLPEEEIKIKEVLTEFGKISDQDLSYVLAAIQKAEQERIDLYTGTIQQRIEL